MDATSKADVLRRVTQRLIPFLFLLYIIAYLDRVNVGFAQLQMKQDLHFGDYVYGLGSGIFFLGYFLFEIPSNLMLKRAGARVWITRIMLTWGVLAMAMIEARTPARFYALRFLLGLAEAGFFPGIILYLTYWFTAAERARIIALFMTATTLANVIGAPISGWLLGVHWYGLAGWQWLFLLEGAPAILLGFVVLAYLPDGPHNAKWLSPEERDWLETRLETEHRANPHRLDTLRQALTNPTVLLLSLLYFSLVVSMYGIALWLPQIVKSFSGLSNLGVGLLTALPYLAATVGMVWVGHHSDRTGERSLHVAIPALIGFFGLLASAYVRAPLPSLLLLTIACVGMEVTLGPFWALPTTFLSGRAAAGGIALVNSVGNLGGFLGPFLVGYVKSVTHSFTGGLLTLAAFLFLGVLLALATRRMPACSATGVAGH